MENWVRCQNFFNSILSKVSVKWMFTDSCFSWCFQKNRRTIFLETHPSDGKSSGQFVLEDVWKKLKITDNVVRKIQSNPCVLKKSSWCFFVNNSVIFFETHPFDGKSSGQIDLGEVSMKLKITHKYNKQK